MTSPSANDIEANNNANNNANNDANNDANNNVPYYNNTNSFLPRPPRRVLVPPLALINEPDLPPGFEPFDFQTFLNIIDLINPLMTSTPRNINEN
jgi:hypothetical protein